LEAYSDAFILIGGSTVPGGEQDLWAQFGFTTTRPEGSSDIGHYFYWEIGVGHGQFETKRVPMKTPLDNSNHSYQIDLDKSTGTWTFSLDLGTGDAWTRSVVSNVWKNKVGIGFGFAGEFLFNETNLPGSIAAPCKCSSFQFKIDGGSWTNANIPNNTTNINSPNFNKWQIQYVSATEIDMWDWQVP